MGKRLKEFGKLLILRHVAVAMLAVLILGFFALITIYAKPLDPIKRAIGDFSFTDIYYEILNQTGEPEECPYITIVDLTKLTDRSDIAQTLRDIEAGEPKVIGVDCCFDNVGEDFDANEELIDVAETYKNIVFSVKFLEYVDDSIGHTKIIHSFFQEFVDITEGTTNMPRGMYDSMKRTVAMGEIGMGKWQPSFSVQVSNTYAGKDLSYGRKDDIAINFSPTNFTVLDPEDVKKHPELISDRVVLLGSMWEDADWHWTPAGKIAGVELLAYSIVSLVNNKEIRDVKDHYPLLFWIISFVLVVLVQMVQARYIQHTSSSKNLFVKYLVGSTYILSMVTFLFTSVFIGLTFMLFKKYNISFNLAWAMSVIAFLTTSRGMYNAIRDYINALSETRPWLKKLIV